MDYSNILIEMEKRRYPIEKTAVIAGLTGAGLRSALKKKTLRIEHLERISKEIGVPMVYWFQDSGSVEDINQAYGRKLIDLLERKDIENQETIKGLRNQVHKLEIEIDELRGKSGYSKASGSV